MKKKIKFIAFFAIINCLFLDFVSAETYNNFTSSYTSCGNGYLKKIPTAIPATISIIYTAIQIAVPIVLVIFGMIDLFKGITASKEEEMKKGRQMFIKRLVLAALIFFIFVGVKLLVSFLADDNSSKILSCTECFIRNSCD